MTNFHWIFYKCTLEILDIYGRKVITLLDNEMLARNIPLKNIQGAVGLTTSRSSAGFTSVEVFPLFGSTVDPLGTPITPELPVSTTATSTPAPKATAAPPVTIPTLNAATPIGADSGNVNAGGAAPYHGVFTGKLSDAGWRVINGNWQFKDGTFTQSKVDGFDFSAVYTKSAFHNFSMQVGLTHNVGSGAGLVFNMPYTDRLAGASMVRYSDKRDNAITWGYFDESGVYQNQGYTDIPHAGTERHTLRIISSNSSYSIYVDGRLVVQSVLYGRDQSFGYIGLLTSRTSVVYDEVTVDGVGALFKGTYTNMDGFSDQRLVSGKWEIANNKAVQTVTNTADYVWNTGVQASQYTITARITLPATSTSGAGFIIHMAERGTKKNAYIVRLKDGGKSIWWGATDIDGKFAGQGSAPVPVSGKVFTLKIVVDLDKLTIFIDDQQIVADVPLPAQDGWIGLVSYGGPVTFEDVKLEVEK